MFPKSSRPRKYTPDICCASLTHVMAHAKSRGYFILNGRSVHPGWISNLPLSMVQRYVEASQLYTAKRSPGFPYVFNAHYDCSTQTSPSARYTAFPEEFSLPQDEVAIFAPTFEQLTYKCLEATRLHCKEAKANDLTVEIRVKL